MTLLAIDTTGPDCAAVLAAMDGQRLAGARLDIGRGHAEKLAPLVADLFDQAGLPVSGLERIGVAIGPGSFAGTRVGVAFARGLALSSGSRAYGISNLEVLARQTGLSEPVWIVHDARRGEIIGQAWNRAGAEQDPARLTRAEATESWQALEARGYRIAGSGAALCGAVGADVSGRLEDAVLIDCTRRALPEASPPSPFYARPPDAKLPGGATP